MSTFYTGISSAHSLTPAPLPEGEGSYLTTTDVAVRS